MLRRRAFADISGGARAGGVMTCIYCGEALAGCLARLGSLRCHDCREQPCAGRVSPEALISRRTRRQAA
jgi:hypothetical protein